MALLDTPPTLKDVARAAGVTPMSVSLALRNEPGVSDATRKRIKALARKMGYQRDPVVANLMAQLKRTQRRQAMTLAFVTNFGQSYQSLRGAQDIRTFDGARKRAGELGYKLDEFQVTNEMDGPRISKILWTRKIEGILVGPLDMDGPPLALDWSRFPCVAIGHSLQTPQIHKSSNNQFQSMVLALSRLHKLGYRRVGVLISRDSDQRVNHAWQAGYLFGCKMLRMPHGMSWVDEGFDRFARRAERQKPDVFLAPSHPDFPIWAWFKKIGRRVPEDVGFASLHLAPTDRNTSGIDQQLEEIGAAAVDHLVGLIHSNQRGIPKTPLTITLDGKWVDGTTAPKVSSDEN